MRLFGPAFAFGLFTASVALTQQPIGPGHLFTYDDGLFSPLEDLSFVSSEVHTTLTHPGFPKHSVRIKKSHVFCDETVNSYTGYIDIEARHIFFYFFESRKDPDTDDVIFWTNGGPGCSSSLGLFMELGPCRVTSENSTAFHPQAWNENANVFFVDQPIGVGFSYAEYGEAVGTTEEAAKDIASFIAIFFEHFTKFKGRAFHMAGESYGGRYLPVFAAEVYDQNTRLVEAGFTPINLQSVLIGNGVTDFSTSLLSYYDMQCTPASVPPVLSIAQCVSMKQIIPRCKRWLKNACLERFDAIDCAAAAGFCEKHLAEPYEDTGLNPYDISRACEGGLGESLCYPIINTIAKYLDQPTLREQLGVDPSITSNFSSCDDNVSSLFVESLDLFHRTHLHIAALLERDIRVLIYVGTYDWICNWVGNERWTLDLEWSGREKFVREELREWTVEGKKAGLVRSHGGFTFVTVDGAGHMVPYDKPKEALAMVQRWLENTEI
ncbi:alpha/beta-hydrolase [Macrolepiota fuliginosa MF-IS2]|uniref:Carboxypeptidase n=1 Tax=Macrolepiota fuliginosa MF-IS2 TaxID=1400762 RepID=A0A9P5X6A6_9AGAR|nr:alpha/beta-hydrolase [Macrolepiota fuliginosa MF-IS2]